MASFEVQPDLLEAAGARQAAIAGSLDELSARLRATAACAAAAAGDGGAAASIASFGRGWSSALEVLASTVGAQGANLGAAAGAYLATDRAVVRRPGP
jgi:hypothetical protein